MIPDNVIPIWSPSDAVDTAQEFAAELDNAEHGQPDKPRWTAKLFGRSRFRRAAIYDGLAVGAFLLFMMAFGAVVWAASAKADPDSDPEAVAWAAHYASAVCSTLSDYPTVNGLQGILNAAMEEGLSGHQAGEAVALSVYDVCPRYSYILDLFVARYGPKTAVA